MADDIEDIIIQAQREHSQYVGDAIVGACRAMTRRAVAAGHALADALRHPLHPAG